MIIKEDQVAMFSINYHNLVEFEFMTRTDEMKKQISKITPLINKKTTSQDNLVGFKLITRTDEMKRRISKI